MQLPTSAAAIRSGYPSLATAAATSEIGLARSGVWGPTTWGSRAERSISTIRSKKRSGCPSTSASAPRRRRWTLAKSASSPRSVARRYASIRSS